jgi:hypothetical protein
MVFIVGIRSRLERGSLSTIPGSISGVTGKTTICPQRRSAPAIRTALSQPPRSGAAAFRDVEY